MTSSISAKLLQALAHGAIGQYYQEHLIPLMSDHQQWPTIIDHSDQLPTWAEGIHRHPMLVLDPTQAPRGRMGCRPVHARSPGFCRPDLFLKTVGTSCSVTVSDLAKLFQQLQVGRDSSLAQVGKSIVYPSIFGLDSGDKCEGNIRQKAAHKLTESKQGTVLAN
jgi:hypothetical protein